MNKVALSLFSCQGIDGRRDEIFILKAKDKFSSTSSIGTFSRVSGNASHLGIGSFHFDRFPVFEYKDLQD
jgi:hypothetical protein